MAAQEHPIIDDDDEDEEEDEEEEDEEEEEDDDEDDELEADEDGELEPPPEHPIFDDIERGDLEDVQARVREDAAVLEERDSSNYRSTPLMHAIACEKPAIALWLLEHRDQHNLDTANDDGQTALHWASACGPLEVVQALVTAGANPAALNKLDSTPLMVASFNGHTDIVACLLQLPPVKASIDAINQYQRTALSSASRQGHQPIVQLLLDAGAHPTIPAGPHSPLNRALRNNHHAIAALLRRAIAEADRVRMCVAWVGTRKGLYKNLYLELLGYLVHAWAIKPAA